MLKLTTSGKVVKVTFALPLDDAPGPVSVVGDFNDWDPLRHPLRKRSNGTRSVAVELAADARVECKYLDADGNWFLDPEVPAVDNEYGEPNMVIDLTD